MKKIVSFIICASMIMCALSVTAYANSYSNSSYSSIREFWYGWKSDDSLYSWMTTEGRVNTLVIHQMSPGEIFKESVSVNDPIESYLYQVANYTRSEYLFGIEIFYDLADGQMTAENFPEVIGWEKFEGEEEINGEIGKCIFVFSELLTQDRVIEIMEAMKDRVGEDILWIAPYYKGLMYGTTNISKLSNYLGEINNDGDIDSKDAAVLLQKLAGWDVEVDELNCDFNYDSEVDLKDAYCLLRFLAGYYDA